MAKLVEMVRNSPLVRRRSGGYEVLDTESKDPFTQGVDFHAHYLASVEVNSKQDSPEVQEKVKAACVASKKATKSMRKVVISVRSTSLRVKDTSTKITDDYPIFLIAYCGGHAEFEEVFFIIHKTKIDKQLRAEIFKLSSEHKVKAVTLTVAKAFNIAYKAWLTEKRKKDKSDTIAASRGSESPLMQRRHLGNSKEAEKPSNLTKLAPGVAKVAGPYTPPVPRKPSEDSRQRRGSFGDEPKDKEGALKNPAVVRVIAKNEKTGSTHNVVLTGDFDAEFQQLAESRSRPDVLRTSLAIDETDHFSMDEIKAYIDSEVEAESKPKN